MHRLCNTWSVRNASDVYRRLRESRKLLLVIVFLSLLLDNILLTVVGKYKVQAVQSTGSTEYRQYKVQTVQSTGSNKYRQYRVQAVLSIGSTEYRQ